MKVEKNLYPKQKIQDHKNIAPKEPQIFSDSVQIGTEPQPEGVKKKWLIMNYVAADNNLEKYQMKQMDSLELLGSDENTHIIAQIDRGPNPESSVDAGLWKDCRRYYITHDETTDALGSKMVEDMGRVNSSAPETLTNFIVWGIKTYPADNVVILLNDHGGGLGGAMADDTEGGFMSLPQLGQAFAKAQEITGKKIDVILFDACKMGTTESAYQLKDSGHFYIGSEANIGGDGLDYKPMFQDDIINKSIGDMQQRMKEDNRLTISPEELAKKVVEVSAEHKDIVKTLSVVDLTKMPKLGEAMDNLAEKIINSTKEDRQLLQDIYWDSQSFDFATPDFYDFVDRISNSEKLQNKEMKEAAENIKELLGSEVIIAEEHNETKFPGAHGLTVYTRPTTKVGKLDINRDTKWRQAMKSIYPFPSLPE